MININYIKNKKIGWGAYTIDDRMVSGVFCGLITFSFYNAIRLYTKSNFGFETHIKDFNLSRNAKNIEKQAYEYMFNMTGALP